MNNKDKFNKLGFDNKRIFKFLNELVFRIDNKQLEVTGFTNIVKIIFNIDNNQLFDLLLATGIIKLKEPNRLSVSGFKKFRINNNNNNFSNWSVRLGFIGAKELHTWSGYNNFCSIIQPNINDINHINHVMGNKINRDNIRTFMNTNFNSLGGGLHNNNNNNNNNNNIKENSLVELYGEKGIISNSGIYENIIKSDEFKKLNFKDKMLVAFGKSGTSRHTKNKILDELDYKVFNFESSVTIPLLSEFFHNEEDKNNINSSSNSNNNSNINSNSNSNNQQENCTIDNSFKDFVNHIRSFLASLEDNKVYKIIPCIKKPKDNQMVNSS